MAEWTQERPTGPGFWWTTACCPPAAAYHKCLILQHPDGIWVYSGDGKQTLWMERHDGPAWWCPSQEEPPPAPPPAALPAWERVLRRELEGICWRARAQTMDEQEELAELIAAIKEEEARDGQ